jgi:outer membrane murein-binding lipoprotein Lpp
MRHIRIIIIAAFLYALLFSGCTDSVQKINRLSESGTFNVELQHQNDIKKGRNDIQLKLTDAFGEVVPGAKINITPWMPEMGHGVMWVPKVIDRGKGQYDVLLILNMGGHWELRLDIIKEELGDRVVFDFMAVKGEKDAA